MAQIGIRDFLSHDFTCPFWLGTTEFKISHVLYRKFKDGTNLVERSAEWRGRGPLSAFLARIGKSWDSHSTHRQEEPDNRQKRKTVLKQCRESSLHLRWKSRFRFQLPWSFPVITVLHPLMVYISTILVSSMEEPEWPVGVWGIALLYMGPELPLGFPQVFCTIYYIFDSFENRKAVFKGNEKYLKADR